ncbi:MAG: DSD1 family PLP-dependent enzyme [Planctomycetota bacterium]
MKTRRLDTPCLVIDLDRLEVNLRRMQEAVGAAGKHLRPHAKTHKCSILARMQVDCGAVGVCVAKVSEARALAEAGLPDILVTGPVVGPGKLGTLAEALQHECTITVVVDSPAQVQALDEMARRIGRRLPVLVALDVGLHRIGVPPDRAPELARRVHGCADLELRGIQAYAGQVQHVVDHTRRQQQSLDCMAAAVEAFNRMKDRGLPMEVFSGAGTGTHEIDLSIPELTEVQAGSYALVDAEYLGIEAFGFEPALTLLSTVVSVQPGRGYAVVDAGLKTVYHHGACPIVVDPAGGFVYDWFGDEYGTVTAPPGGRPPGEGEVVELVVSHCDPTVNLFDRFYVTRGDEVVDTWPIDLRGLSR